MAMSAQYREGYIVGKVRGEEAADFADAYGGRVTVTPPLGGWKSRSADYASGYRTGFNEAVDEYEPAR